MTVDCCGDDDDGDGDDVSCRLARAMLAMAGPMYWRPRRDGIDGTIIYFGRVRPEHVQPPHLALVDRWPPAWVPRSLWLPRGPVEATYRFWEYVGDGGPMDCDEPEIVLHSCGDDDEDVVCAVFFWMEGLRGRVNFHSRAMLAGSASLAR